MFSAFTSSRRQGRPVELYEFSFGPTNLDYRRYTDAEFPITIGEAEFAPIPIMRAIINNNGTLDKSSMSVNLPQSLDLPQMFRVYPPAMEVNLTIWQAEAEDPDAQFLALWHGRVLSCAFMGVEAELACEPISTTLSHVALRRHYQYMCPHMLYGPKCRASKIAATTQAQVHTAEGRQVTLTTAIANPERYLAGAVEWFTPAGLLEARMIVDVSEVLGRTVFKLSGIVRDMSAGSTISAIYGCQHVEEACSEVHDNIPNFGGMPWIPVKNPVGANSPY